MKPVAVISGGARGIGKATVLAFLDSGYTVVSFNVHKNYCDSICDELKDRDFRGIVCDVTEEKDVRSAFDVVMSEFGRVDALVNIVGGSFGISASIDELSLDAWESIINLNLRSTFLCTREAVGIMKKQKYGRIVNMSSLAGRSRSFFGGVAYASAKAGVLGFTRQCSKDLAPFGITVNAVAPGTVMSGERIEAFWNRKSNEDRDMFFKTNPSGRMGTPDEVAKAILFLCSKEASFINGATLDINGGMWVG